MSRGVMLAAGQGSRGVGFLPLGENMRRLIGISDIPLLLPVILSVSASISLLISSKSEYFLPFWCRNSPHSEEEMLFSINNIARGGTSQIARLQFCNLLRIMPYTGGLQSYMSYYIS